MNAFIQQNVDLYKGSDGVASQLLLFANGNRLRILCQLASGPMLVGEIEESVDLSQSAVSQHLTKLRKAGVINFKKDSQTNYYYIKDEKVLALMVHLHKVFV